MITFSFTGAEQVQDKLRRLGNAKKAKSITRKALRQAANVVRDSARQKSKAIDDPKTKEKISKNIAVAGSKSRNQNELKMKVGVRGGASFSNSVPPNTSGGDTRHWRWIELGSAHNLPTPFMRTALSTNIQNCTSTFVQVFTTELDKELRL